MRLLGIAMLLAGIGAFAGPQVLAQSGVQSGPPQYRDNQDQTRVQDRAPAQIPAQALASISGRTLPMWDGSPLRQDFARGGGFESDARPARNAR